MWYPDDELDPYINLGLLLNQGDFYNLIDDFIALLCCEILKLNRDKVPKYSLAFEIRDNGPVQTKIIMSCPEKSFDTDSSKIFWPTDCWDDVCNVYNNTIFGNIQVQAVGKTISVIG
ncbi:MAG: hypothetical protein ACI8PW_000817 [Methylophilaceae bacterium]|jgi:hypothetical protein